MCYEIVELEEGTPVVWLAVHTLRWNWQEWGEPKVGLVDCDCHTKVEELEAHCKLLEEQLTDVRHFYEKLEAQNAQLRDEHKKKMSELRQSIAALNYPEFNKLRDILAEKG